MSEIMKLKKT